MAPNQFLPGLYHFLNKYCQPLINHLKFILIIVVWYKYSVIPEYFSHNIRELLKLLSYSAVLLSQVIVPVLLSFPTRVQINKYLKLKPDDYE
ncbi:hypothetical protein MMC2321_04070 [Chitinophaga sp. MM2321]